MVEVKKRAIQECRLIVRDGRKIALLRDLALQLGCEPELVSDLQGHYKFKQLKLNHIKKENGL